MGRRAGERGLVAMCRSRPSVPSASPFSCVFFCLLDVHESRGVPRPRLGGPAFDPSVPSAPMAGPVRNISYSWCLSRSSSRASRKKRAARNCCCRRHERSGGPTAPDSNQLGLKHGLIARRFKTMKAGTPPPGERAPNRAEHPGQHGVLGTARWWDAPVVLGDTAQWTGTGGRSRR